MISKGIYGFILFLVCLSIDGRAQNQILFPGPDKPGGLKDKQTVEREFALACNKMLSDRNNTATFEQWLGTVHDLSRSGMAGMVWPALLKISKDAVFFASLNDKSKLNILSELGAACYYDNRFQIADSVFRITLDYWKGTDSETSTDYAFSCNFLGLTSLRLGNLDSSLVWFDKAMQIRIRLLGGNHPLVGAVYNNIGLLCKSKGDYEGALFNYRKAIDIKNLAHDKTVFLNLLNLGELYGVRGQYATALGYYKQADSILQQEAPSLKMADLYLNSGAMMYSLQAYHEAMDYFTKALRIYDFLLGENNEQSGRVFQNMANVYNGLDDKENEKKSIEKALSILEPVYGHNHAEMAPLYNNLGMVYQSLGNVGKSFGYLDKARKIYLENREEQPEKLVNTLINIADNREMAGQIDSAIVCYRDAIKKLDGVSNGHHPYISAAYNALAGIFLKAGNIEKADTMVNLAIRSNMAGDSGKSGLPESVLDPGYLFQSSILKAKISWKSDTISFRKAEAAFGYFRKADSLLSLQRNSLFDTSDKIAFARSARLLAESSLEYAASGQAHFLSGRLLAEAFRYAGKSKNLVLLQSIQEEQARYNSGIPDSLLKKEEDLRGNINALVHQIELEKGKNNTGMLEDRLFRNKKAYKILVEEMERDYPVYQDIKYSDNIPEIHALQNAIGKESALLAYFVGDGSVYRFTILHDRYILNRYLVRDMDDLLTGMRKGITLGLDQVYQEKAEKLSPILIPDHLPDAVKNLVVVPDGGLSLIPFEALFYKKPDLSSDPGDWPYLIKKYVISYTPSLAIWKNLRDAGEDRSVASLIAYAPVFGKNNAPPESDGSEKVGSYRAAFPLQAPLYATRAEVTEIDSLFHRKGFTADLRLDAEASENSLITADLEKYAYIHIATHGFVNENNPGLSGLYFYPSADSVSDNILYLSEIYKLKLNARLIVLSACETGLGKMAAGEGVLGFSRAFLFAGARNLLLSLWKVNDVSTTDLMTRFYSYHIENGVPLAESLRNAKLSLIRNPRTSHPYFWAPFVLNGN